MPNDHSKQDQHDQKKELKYCDHTGTNEEDQVYYDSISDDDTFHDASQVEDRELGWNMKKYQVDNDISIHYLSSVLKSNDEDTRLE